MRRVEHLQGRISALEAGDGPIAVLIHGFPLDARMWTDQLTGLAGPFCKLVAVDLRGHGHSPWLGDEVNGMDLLASDVVDLIESLDQGPVDLVGLSMGGYVALALADRRPDLIRTLGLVDTKPTADSEEGKAGRDATAVALLSSGRAWLAETLMPKLVADSASLIVKGRMCSMIETQSYEAIVADLAGMRDRPDRSGVLSSIEVPVGIIVGEEDVLTPPSDAEAMAALCETAEVSVVPGAGHMAPMEAPEAVNRALTALWARGSDAD
jgi:pimeloyl-ACP methyl ester carboxylesterase